MGEFDILCQTTVPISSYEEPDDFVVEYRAMIRHDGELIGEAVLCWASPATTARSR